MKGRSPRRILIALTLLAGFIGEGLIAGWPAGAQVARDVVVAKVPVAVRQAEGFDSAQSAGLFVGIRDFTEDEFFAEVPFAVDDAVDLAYLFVRELELIRPEKVVLSLSGEPRKAVSRTRLARLLAAGATREPAEQTDILRLLDRQRKASGPRGLFVVTFATHGFSDEGSDSLVAADSLRPFIKRTGVVLSEVFDVVSRATAPRRLVLLDACRERFTAARGTGGLRMSESFDDAVAAAQGQAVIFGATLGGFAYDDLKRQNGVFTAAVIDGLQGGAPTDARHFITVRTLADYVNKRVLAWVRDNRAEDAAVSRGISRRVEGELALMPLAVDGGRLRAMFSYQQRRDAGLDQLRRNLEAPLSGAMYDEMKVLLAADAPSPERVELLDEIEALDGSERMRNALAFYWQNQHASPVSPTSSSSRAERGRRTTSGPPVEGGRSVENIAGVEFAWRFIPSGEFKMGSPKGEEGRYSNETPHKVMLTRGFWMAETEVTQGQWKAVMETSPSKFKKCGARCPVEQVNWYEAVAFANALSRQSDLAECYTLSGGNGKKAGEGLEYEGVLFKGPECMGYRLPTEAEWEYAARAGEQRAIYTGVMTIEGDRNSPELDKIAWYGGNSGVTYEGGWDCSGWKGKQDPSERCGSHPVDQKKENAWGLVDMLGNVREWVWDWHGKYPETAGPDPLGPEGGLSRVARGGSWYGNARNCRAANRNSDVPSIPHIDLGFRLVRTLP